jgi:hypothetical protein
VKEELCLCLCLWHTPCTCLVKLPCGSTTIVPSKIRLRAMIAQNESADLEHKQFTPAVMPFDSQGRTKLINECIVLGAGRSILGRVVDFGAGGRFWGWWWSIFGQVVDFGAGGRFL